MSLRDTGIQIIQNVEDLIKVRTFKPMKNRLI